VAALEWRPKPEDKEAFIDALDLAAEGWALANPDPGVGDAGAPLWWDEDDASAEALALNRRLGGRRT
jgi:hypothetical protein